MFLKKIIKKSSFIIFLLNFEILIERFSIIYKSNNDYFISNVTQLNYLIFYIFFCLINILFFSKPKWLLFISIIFFQIYFFQFKQNLQASLLTLNYSIFQCHIIISISLLIIIILLYFIIIIKQRLKEVIVFLAINLIFTQYDYFKLSISSPNNNFILKNNYLKINKNLYVFLLDEYPSNMVIKKYFNKDVKYHIGYSLSNYKFKTLKTTYSNYNNTESSTLSILTANLPKDPNINQTIAALKKNVFSKGENFEYYYFSIFDDKNRPNSLVQTQFFNGLNNITIRYIIPFFVHLTTKRGSGNFTDYDDYNENAYLHLKEIVSINNLHVLYQHLYTPHYFPLVENQSFGDRMKNANFFILRSVKYIQENDPKAGIIILSDHGYRDHKIPLKFHNRNILYYKNVQIDTAAISKFGIYKLFAKSFLTKF